MASKCFRLASDTCSCPSVSLTDLKHSPSFATDQLLLGACTKSFGLIRSTNSGRSWVQVPLPLVHNQPCKARGCVSEGCIVGRFNIE